MFENKTKDSKNTRHKDKNITINNIEGGTLSQFKDRPLSNTKTLSNFTTDAMELKRKRIMRNRRGKTNTDKFEEKL